MKQIINRNFAAQKKKKIKKQGNKRLERVLYAKHMNISFYVENCRWTDSFLCVPNLYLSKCLQVLEYQFLRYCCFVVKRNIWSKHNCSIINKICTYLTNCRSTQYVWKNEYIFFSISHPTHKLPTQQYAYSCWCYSCNKEKTFCSILNWSEGYSQENECIIY